MRKNPVERSAGTAHKVEHLWALRAVGQGPEGTSRFEWRCTRCQSDTFTNSRGAHDTPEDNLPGRRALQATWVPEDCEEALVQAVCEL